MRETKRTRVVCTLGTDADLFHVVKTVTGLCRLQAKGRIDLTLRLSPQIGQHAILLEWNGTKAGIDLSDHSDRRMPELADCDIYFKRCVLQQDLKSDGHIRPFGLNYACRSTSATLRLLALFGPLDLMRRRSAWKKLLCVPLIADFEREPAQAARQTILFQARVWDPSECPGDENVNEDRVSLLRALRHEFKGRLAGGLVPTPYAHQHYPELLTTQSARQSRYVRWARQHLISIGFRGLFGSLGFKIAEAFAASQCLVSEPTLSYLSPEAPISQYHDIKKCITICERLLTHPVSANELRLQAGEFYRREVEPGVHISKLLDLVQ